MGLGSLHSRKKYLKRSVFMETRFKLPTKILSSFLAVLMAVSCFGIALPNLAPTASAAATSQDYKSLKNAFAGVTEADGSINSGKYTVSAGESGETVVEDKTSDGSVYKLAEALFKVASAESSSFKHNSLIRARIKSVFAKNGDTYTASMEAFVKMLLPVDGDYATDSTAPVKGSPKLVSAGEPEAVYTKTLTSVVKVTRSEKSVVLTYDNVNDVPSKLDLTVKLTTVADPKSEKKTFTDAAGLEYAQLSTWYENTSSTVEYEQKDAPDFTALKKYMGYLKSASFAPYYDAYKADVKSIYTFDASVLEKFEEKYDSYAGIEAVYGLDNDYLDKYLTTGEGETLKTGLANMSAYKSFAAKMTAAYNPVFNKRFVDWAMKGTSVDKYIDRDAYLPRANSAGEVIEPERKTVEKLLEQAKTIKDILNDATYNNIYVEQYGYVNGTIEDLVQKIYVAYQRFDLDKLFENIVFRMENNADKYFDDDMAYFGLANYDSTKYATGDMPITDEMLDTAIEWFDKLFTKIDDDAMYDDEGRDAAVAAAGSSTIKTYAQVKDFYNKLVAERQSENRKQDNEYIDNFHSYFDSFIYEAPSLDTVYMANAYSTGIDAKVAECRTAYNAAVTKLGKAAADKIFGNFTNRANLAKAAIKTALNNRLYAQCQLMQTYANGGTITESNFSLVKAQYGNINNAIIPATVDGKETKISLYQWCKNQGYSGADGIYNMYESTYKTKIEAIMAKKFAGFRKIDLSKNGVYTVRHAVEHDMVRYMAGDGASNERYAYEVNKTRVNTVITKLDTFLTSKSFTQLIGVDGESKYGTGANITNLSEYIEDMLLANVFSDKMVNTLVGSLFPMVANLLTDMFANLNNLLGDIATTPTRSSAQAAIDLSKLGVSNIGNSAGKIRRIEGTLNISLDGNDGTADIEKAFSDLGIKIYPQYFADAIGRAASPVFYDHLKAAKDDWSWFDKISNGGNGDGEVDAKDFIKRDSKGEPILDKNKNEQPKYAWGVTDYNSFTVALGNVFNSILPLLQVVLTNRTYETPKINRLIYAYASPAKAHYTLLGVKGSASLSGTNGYGSGSVKLSGTQGYNNLWGPIMEAAGITATTSSKDVTVNNPLSTTLGTAGDGASAKQIVNGLFMPIYVLIKKVASKPIESVMDILPNVAYFLSYGLIEPLLENIATSISLYAEITKLDINGGFLAKLASLAEGAIQNAVNKNLKFENLKTLKVSELVNLSELLGCDITDLNSILNMVVNKLGDEENTEKKVDLPAINASKLGHLGNLTSASSIRTVDTAGAGAGRRYTITADRPDVLYDILSWVLKFISGDGNLSGLMAAIGSSGLGAELDGILAEIDADGALAALVELFLPRGSAGSGYNNGYDFASYDWYNASQGEWSYGATYTDFVYTKYANYWTKAKAEYLFDNLETVANDIIKRYIPNVLIKGTKEDGTKEYYDGINDWLASVINNMFNNEGIHNLTKVFSKIGEALAGNQTIIDLLKEQINGGQGVDLACWYNTFGYLDYDYTALDKASAVLASSTATDAEKAKALETVATAPLRPGETRRYTDADGVAQTLTYKSDFPLLTVKVAAGSKKVSEGGTELNPLTDNIASHGEDVSYEWTYNGRIFTDEGTADGRRLFTDMFVYLFTPSLPLVNILLTNKDLTLFNNALVIKGYDCYSNGLVPVMEMLGITGLPTTAAFQNMDAMTGLNTLVNKLFDYVTYLLTPDAEGTTVQKVVKLIPRIFYFLQSDGITTVLKNLLQPIWVLIDTLRPIADVDLDGFVHQFLCDYLGLAYDRNAEGYKVGAVVELVMNLINKNKLPKEYTAAQIAADKSKVDAIYGISIEDLCLTEIYKVVELMFDVDLSPLSYAFEGMCISYTAPDGKKYGRVSFTSARGATDWTLNYSGADTLTVTVSVLLDLLRWKDNAAGFDKLFGFVKEHTDKENEITATGLLQALEVVFTDKPFDLGKQPNWDYIFEGKEIKRSNGDYVAWTDIDADDKNYAALLPFADQDISEYHSIYNLGYFTDWTETTARDTVEMLTGILDYVATFFKKSDDSKPDNFKDFITDLLVSKVFNGEILKKLAELMAKMYNAIPASAVDLIDHLLDTSVTTWRTKYLVTTTNAEGIIEYTPNPDYTWWADPASAEYVDTKDEFIKAVHELIDPASKLFAWIFLSEDVKLFYTYGEGVNKKDYGEDAIILDGIGAYAKAIIPLLEALGYTDLRNFEFVDGSIHDISIASYQTVIGEGENAQLQYNDKMFANDIVEVISKLVEDIVTDPINWVLDRLPGMVYFINAKGITTIVENVFESVKEVIDTINTLLDSDKQINLAAIAKIINDAVGTETTDITGELGDKLVLDFDTIIALLEKFTGIHINSTLVKYMKGLYVGKIKAFTSGSGRQSFTMVYSDNEEKHDMVTILIALLLEVVEDKGTENGKEYDNPAAIDRLITKADEENKGMVSAIINAIRNPKDIVEKEMNWNYFDESKVIASYPNGDKPNETVTIPAYKFLYLNYTTDWTKDTAKSVKDSLNDLALAVLKMVDKKYESATDVSAVVNDLLKLDVFYSAETLNKVLNLLADNLYGEKAVIPEELSKFAGALLGADLTAWKYNYTFETVTSTEGFNAPDETGLYWKNGTVTTNVQAKDGDGNLITDADGNPVYETKEGKIYAIRANTETEKFAREDFISGITLILKPAYRLLNWLLFGDDYTFFNSQQITGYDELENEIHPVLITLKGSNGYGEALSYLLEALGCVGGNCSLKAYSYYITKDPVTLKNVYNTQALVDDVLTAVCNRIDKIMADPVYEIAGMIPELIYFINANGLSVVVNNLLSGVIGLISSEEVQNAVGMKLNINDLVTNVLRKALKSDDLTFDIDGVNLRYIFEIAEKLTGLEINDAIGSNLQYFYMGDLKCYLSASTKLAYRLVFSENELDNGGNGQLQDFITILLSTVVDVLMYKQNAATIVNLAKLDINVEVIEGVIDFLKEGFEVNTLPYDWFYFDPDLSKYEIDPDTGKLKKKSVQPDITPATPGTLPANSINYLTYASDWTEDTAEYIYQHRNDIIASVLRLTKADSTDLGQIIANKVNLEKNLYTAANLNKILDLVKPTLGKIDDTLLKLLNIVVDIDLSSLKNMAPFTDEQITDRTTFVNGLCTMIQPLYPILDWLLFGKNIEYFDKKDYDSGDIQVLIKLPGSDGYLNGLVPLLEALGVILPEYKDGQKTKDVFYVLVNNILARVEGILSNPVDEALALIPELLYFINANGLATCVNNLLAGVVALLDKINPALGDNAVDIQTLINKVLEDANVDLDLSKLDLLAIAKVVEDATGIELTDIFTEKKIDNFYFGKIVHYESADKTAVNFKMVYSEEQGPADMLTFIVNLAIEILLYKDEAKGIDNARAIDFLINGKDEITGNPKKETVGAIVNMLLGVKNVEKIDLNWNYFDEDAVLGSGITVPANAFVYLNYSNDWTYSKAAYLDENLDKIISEVLKLTGSDADSVADLLAGKLNLNEFMSADNLNKILDALKGFLYGENSVLDDTLFELIGLVLGADLTQWKDSYKFEAYDKANTYEGTEYGLQYRTVDGVKTYAIGSPDNFADGLAVILQPAERLLGWLLMGESYGFFVDNKTGNVDPAGVRQNGELIRLTGADGYDAALTVLLEALGCKGLKKANAYANCGEMLSAVIKSVVARIDELLKDPVNEVFALIPEIIYFINAGGLNSVVNNLAGAVVALLKEAEPLTGKAVDIDTLLTEVIKKALGDKAPADFRFTLEGVNLQWAIDFAEMFTGLEIGDAIGYGLEKFALGVVEKYESASSYYNETYKMRFATDHNGEDKARDRADLITILFSVVLDVLEYDPEGNGTYPNADALAKLINNDKVTAKMIRDIIKVLKGYVIDGVKPIDWFYFDADKSVYTTDAAGNRVVKNPLPEFDENSVNNVPENTINYLTYASDWNKDTAQYLDDNLEAIIAEVLALTGKGNTTVAEIIAEKFSLTDLYTADNLNAIVKEVKKLTDQIGETLTSMVGMVLGADLTAYNTMKFTDAEITDRTTFVNGLVRVLTPLTPLLDWLLFGDSLKFFSAKDTPVSTDVTDLINITGYEGYSTGLVPILEALGVVLPDCTAATSTTDILGDVVDALLTRVENILADPVNEVLGLLPNILYFINANGISASVQNLLGAVFGLLDTVNPILGDKKIDVNALINDLLAKNNINATVDINDLDLLAVVKVIEAATGLKITETVKANKIDNFRIGNIEYFRSSNGKAAFRMKYSDTQGRIDMLTVVINFLVEVITADGNAEALEKLLKLDAGTISKVVKVLTGSDSDFAYKAFNWNYFDKNVDLNNAVTTVPAYSFVYLNYANDWTYDKAAYLDSGLTALVNAILKMVAKDDDPVTVEDLIAKNVDLNKLVFNADILNKLLTAVSGLFYGEKAVIGQHLGEVAGLVLGGELSQWNDNYSFAAFDAAATYLTDGETGLRYTVDSGKAIFAIENSDDFIAGLCKILQPLGKILGWLLLGEGYEFFVKNELNADGTQDTILKIPGKKGYANGLGYLLEALGVKGLKSEYANADALLKDVLTKLVARVTEILANPIDEVLALIPELIYFINANGLGVTVYNLLSSVMNIFDTVKNAGLLDSIEQIKDYNNGEELVNGLVDGIIKDKVSADLTFTLDGINLEWVLKVVETVTGLDLRSHINSLEKFAIGEVYKYESVSGSNAYKMRFGKTGNGTDKLRDRADMITIVLSYVIDLLTIEQNQTKIEEMAKLNAGTVASILALLSEYKYDIGVDVKWFYFDESVSVETITPETDLKEFTPTINYLTYASAWTETLADYLSNNLDDVIASILDMAGKGDTTVAQIIKDAFDPEKDLYTAEILNKLAKSIADLTSKVDETLLNTLGIILDVDLGAYAKMDFGTGRVGKDGFIEGICEIVKPLSGVLDWLLFGDSYNFFSNDKTGVQNLITINGYSGYAYGLVPLLEALGVKLPDVTAESNTENTVNSLVTALVDRIDEILVDPVNEALALIPNVLYFINANGLASAVNNLLGAALGLVDRFNKENLIEKLGLELDLDGDGVNDTEINLNGLINKLLKDNNINVTLDIKKLDLIEIVKVLEAVTGMDLTTFVRENGIENFYLGQITYFKSANGSAAFRMEYSSDKNKDRSDLITVVVNYLIEAALYGENAKALDILISGKNDDGTPKKNTVEAVIDMLGKLGTKALPGDFHWNYMNEDSDDVTPEPEYTEIVLPATPFNNYLTYCTDWTQKTADTLYDNLGTVVDSIIKMTKNGDSLADLINGKFTLYKAEYLNKILEATEKLYDLADAKVIKLLGLVLSCDLSKWDGMQFIDADVTDAATFAAGLTEIVEPIYPLLDWLLFGKDYGFFVDDKTGNTGEDGKTLINIAGADGYINGLAPLFIALGVDLPEYREGYTCETTVKVDGVDMTFFNAVIKAVLARVDAVLANPVDEALDLLPGLLYFINANGVSTAAYNLLGGVLNAVNVLVENGILDLGGTSVEEYVETKLGLNVKNLDLEGIVKFLENKNITKGIKIYDVFRGTYTVDDGKVTFTPDLSADGNILEKFYCGEVKPYTYSGITGWKMVTKAGTGRGDMITTLLSIVLEVLFYDGNEQPITDIIAGKVEGFTVENFRNLKALLTTGVDLEAAMKNIDWVYFNNYATDAEREEAIKNVLLDPASNVLPSTQPVRTMNYLQYDNNWNRETAKYIDDNIVSIVDLVIAKFVDGSDSLTDLINNKLNLYSDETANKILAKIGNLLKKLDDSLVETIGVVLDVDLKALTAPVSGVTDKTTFVAALANRLSNIGNVLDWLLFDQQMTFFTDLETGAQAKIVLNGGEGYKYGLAPILEAIGVDTHITVPAAAEGTTITARVLVELLTNVCDRIDEVLADPINEALALLPELIYFINANGVSVSATNLVAPIDALLKEVGRNIGKDDLDFSSLVKFDISNLDFEGIFAIVLDKTGIDAQSPIGEYLAKFYFGQLESYQSYDGVQGFRMVYSDTEKRYEFVTILVTLLLDVASYGGNKDAIIKLLGNDEKADAIYKTVMAFISGSGYTEVQVPMKQFDWILTEFADTGKVLSPITMGSIFEYVYGPLYTREMGEYITKYLPHFINTMITLLGVEIKGVNIKNLDDLLDQLIGKSIYTTENLNKLLKLIQGLVPKLKEAIGDELFNHLATIVNNSLGVDLNYWNGYTVNAITTGDQTAFVNEAVRMLRPAYPILEWLLCDKSLAFFNTKDGNDYIVIESAEGYAYGIIPLLEALHCEGVLSIDAYKAAAAADKDNIIRNILNPLLTKVNKVLEDPVNQVLDLLPAVIYFLNSEGLDTVVRNTLNAVVKVLETVEPVAGKDLDLATLFGFDFKVDIEGLLDQALKGIEEKYGFKLATVATEAIKELTVGQVVTFDSLSGQWVYDGHQAYTMKYAGKSGDQVDMVTIILRLILRFISDPQNVKAIEAMLKPKLNENGYKFLTSLLDNFSQMVSTPDGMDKVMYTVYYIFYSANVAASSTNNWLAEFNGNYSFLNQLFATSDLAFMRQLEKSLGDLLNKYTPDIADDDEVVPNGFVKFFKAIAAFFQKIIKFFQNMFKKP